MKRRRQYPVGVRPWKGSLQAFVEIHGKTHSKSFPLTTPTATLSSWREQQRRTLGRLRSPHGSFRADIEAYLQRVAALPTYKQRAAHLHLWAAELDGDRARQTITTAEIDEVMQRWLQTPSRPKRGRPSSPDGIAPATVRKRRTALLSLFHRLDGKDAPNPVRASANPREPKPEARGLDYTTVERILAAMPESLTKRRIAVLAWTGLPPIMLGAITPADLDLNAETVRVRPRRKGAGVEARTLPLLPDGVRAFAEFHRRQAYGRFSVTAAARSFKRACIRANVRGVTLYDLRHSFLTLLYRATKDLATVARFGLHASVATTARYAQAAMQDVDRLAATVAGTLVAEQRDRDRDRVSPPKRSFSATDKHRNTKSPAVLKRKKTT